MMVEGYNVAGMNLVRIKDFLVTLQELVPAAVHNTFTSKDAPLTNDEDGLTRLSSTTIDVPSDDPLVHALVHLTHMGNKVAEVRARRSTSTMRGAGRSSTPFPYYIIELAGIKAAAFYKKLSEEPLPTLSSTPEHATRENFERVIEEGLKALDKYIPSPDNQGGK